MNGTKPPFQHPLQTKLKVTLPTPILSTPKFKEIFGGKDGSTLSMNDKGLVYEVEFVAIPGMVCEQIASHENGILEIMIPFYSTKSLYIDNRAVEICKNTEVYSHSIPCKATIENRIVQMVGKPYIWGGNWSQGIPEMLEWYKPANPLDPITYAKWTLSGLDCSGMLFEATQGMTPRNTRKLIHFGTRLPLSVDHPIELEKQLQPLDLIVWPGHIIYSLGGNLLIESRLHGGVVYSNLHERLEELKNSPDMEKLWDQIQIRRFTTT